MAVSFAAPIFAQQKDTVDPQVVEQLRVEDKNFEEAYNKHDAAAIAALFTDEAVLVTLVPWNHEGIDAAFDP